MFQIWLDRSDDDVAGLDCSLKRASCWLLSQSVLFENYPQLGKNLKLFNWIHELFCFIAILLYPLSQSFPFLFLWVLENSVIKMDPTGKNLAFTT